MSQRYRLFMWVLLATIVIEVVTVVLRFGMGWESTRDTASTIGYMTAGVRIHHSYCGVLLIMVAWALAQTYPRMAMWTSVFGWALLLSDVIHHFLVLWLITGSPQFDLTYAP